MDKRRKKVDRDEAERTRASKAMHDRTQIIVPAMKASTKDDISWWEGKDEMFQYASAMHPDDEASARRVPGEQG